MRHLFILIASSIYRRFGAIYLRFLKGEVANNLRHVSDNGYLYIVTGDGYAKECLFSIQSLKRYNSEKVCVFSEEKYRQMLEPECDFFFVINSKLKRPKIEYMSQSPFKNTVYLDSDTFITTNISDLFELVLKYDFGGVFCNSRKRENYSKAISKYAKIPYSFSEINTGVMVFNNSVEVRNLFLNWNKYYYKYLAKTNGWDQPSFRIALWESNVKLCHLPPEYNVRPKSVFQKVRDNKKLLGKMHMEPRIYHAHYSPDVHLGKYEINSLNQLKGKLKDLVTDIIY